MIKLCRQSDCQYYQPQRRSKHCGLCGHFIADHARCCDDPPRWTEVDLVAIIKGGQTLSRGMRQALRVAGRGRPCGGRTAVTEDEIMAMRADDPRVPNQLDDGRASDERA